MADFDPDERQRIILTPQAGDNAPVAITHLQAMRCAAVVQAVMDGHVGYETSARDVVRFLQIAAIEADDGEGVVDQTAAEVWAKIEELPWPPAGPPQPQQDVDYP